MSINDITPEQWNKGQKTQSDPVNHPAHYTTSKIECIDYLEDNLAEGFSYFLEGNVKKYLHRFRYKNADPIEDLKKAQWYLNRLINELQK